jgi:hypothetical protein
VERRLRHEPERVAFSIKAGKTGLKKKPAVELDKL